MLDVKIHLIAAPATIIAPINITELRSPLVLKYQRIGKSAAMFMMFAQLPSKAIVVSSQNGHSTGINEFDMGPKQFHIIAWHIPRDEKTANMYHLLRYTHTSVWGEGVSSLRL